ncbi:MAG: TIGR03032 family protein [Comamonas sp.]
MSDLSRYATDEPVERADEALSSVHSSNLPLILKQLRATLLITTYQAGKLILARADHSALNTHFVHFPKPMGVATDLDRIMVGSATGIHVFRNVPNLAERVAPHGRHDAVYAERHYHITGDIDIHEMGIDREGRCWFINTRFSCLCTLDAAHSFVPRWWPSFVSSLAPEDRCHLNGLAMVDGAPRYVTALGATDVPRGWSANKKNGGVLLDVPSGELIASGLSMPHSPRWHRGALWLLESGTGTLARIDAQSGRVETIARVPGFARGLDFAGPLAFIGLSQLRETNAFTDIPITDENSDRMSGVWVVNIETGKTVALLKFNNAVQEIFAVQLLANVQYPDVLRSDHELLRSTYVLPDARLKDVSIL